MDRVSSNGVRLATRMWAGSGPTIVAVHGLTANHTCWYPLADMVTPEFRLVAYDLRGRGRCRLVVVPDTNHYTILLGDHALVKREVLAFLRG